jgi:hypothetical protein
MMHSLHTFFSFLVGFASVQAHPQPLDTFNNATVWQAPPSWPDRSTSYARATLLTVGYESETPPILATWTGSGPGGPYFQIMESNDAGRSWYEISKAYFNHGNETGGSFAGGIILQPFLYELPEDVGGFSKGTVLLSGNAIPADFASTNIQLYASIDKG